VHAARRAGTGTNPRPFDLRLGIKVCDTSRSTQYGVTAKELAAFRR
jgi:hypothetical protein